MVRMKEAAMQCHKIRRLGQSAAWTLVGIE
jgi:hypothetical protein